jgi:hypothetical protein
MTSALRTFFGFLLAVCVSLVAGGVEVTVDVHKGASRPATPLKAVLSASPFGIAERGERTKLTRTMEIAVPGKAVFDLPDGQWRLALDVPGYFADAQIVSGGPEAKAADFVVWPTGWIEGEFVWPKNVNAPNQAIVRFEAHDPNAADAPPSSFSVCTLKENKWRCEVAAGRIDVRLRATHFMTHFRSGLEIKPGATLNLGVLRLEPGSSVVGYLRSEEKIKLTEARVVLMPVSFENPLTAVKNALTARVQDTKGLFEFRGVPAGQYKLFASHKNLLTDEVLVDVGGNAEAELREPLILNAPRKLSVEIQPPLDSRGDRWHVSVAKELSAARWDVVTESAADDKGVLSWSGLRSGHYSVSVGSSPDSTMAVKDFEAVGSDVALNISIPETEVEGTLRLGSSPLEAAVIVGGSDSPVAVRLEANAAGEFSGSVPFPPAGVWEITIERQRPQLQRTLMQRVEAPAEGKPVHLDLELPSGAITGTVVDTEGKPVERATVNVRSPNKDEDFVQVQVERNGSFVLEGLAAGAYDLQAWTFDQRDSDIVPVTVSDSGADASVQLIVKKQDELVGRVVSRFGPVQGARVFLYPTDVPTMVVIPRTTDANGVFVVPVPRGCAEANVAIIAMGLPFRAQHVVLDKKPMTIGLDQIAGNLEVDVPEPSDDPTSPQGFILHKGALLPILFFISNRDTLIKESSRAGYIRATVPLLEGGDYAVCRMSWPERTALRSAMPPAGRCAFGNLVPFGTLSLTAP